MSEENKEINRKCNLESGSEGVIKPCPCGETPDTLCLMDNGQGSKWGNATCNKCGEWTVEFRTKYHSFDSKECMEQAIIYWNEAPRAL